MPQSLTNSVSALAAHARSISGIKYAPENAPDNIAAMPFAVVYPARGQILAEGAGQSRNIHLVFVEFHFSRVLLPSALALATAVIEPYGDLLVNDPMLGGACDAIPMGLNENILYEFGWLEWGTVKNLGVRLHVPVKIRRAV